MSNPSARGVRCKAADHLLGLRVRIPLKVKTYTSYVCCTLSVNGFCDGPIPRQEEPFECVYVCVRACVVESYSEKKLIAFSKFITI